MNEISVADADIATLAAWLAERRDYVSDFGKSEDIRPTAIKVIHCVLSLRRSYDRFVKPRLNAFMEKPPNIQKVADLADLMDSFQSLNAFLQQELNYNYEEHAYTLQSVVEFVCSIVKEAPTITEEEACRQWAIQAKPEEYQKLNIKGVGIAGFQYPRMLFGADTVKPDVHVKRCFSDLLDRNVSRLEVILLLEKASKREGLFVRSVDKFIWNRGARSDEMANGTERNDELSPEYDETLLKNGTRGKYAEQYAAGTNIVRLDPDIAAAFPNEKAVNDALRSVLKERNKEE